MSPQFRPHFFAVSAPVITTRALGRAQGGRWQRPDIPAIRPFSANIAKDVKLRTTMATGIQQSVFCLIRMGPAP